MRWSKLKARVEENFADSMRGRVEIHDTWYRRSGRYAGRSWITLDGREIRNLSDLEWFKRYYELKADLTATIPGWTLESQRGVVGDDQVGALLAKEGQLSRNLLYEALYGLLASKPSDSIESENPLQRALALVDRRFGKRSLQGFELRVEEDPLVRVLYEARIEAEGIRLPAAHQQ